MTLREPYYPSGVRHTKDLLMQRGRDDGAVFLGALRNLAACPGRFLDSFAREEVLDSDELGRFVLVYGKERIFRAVFAYDEFTQLIVQDITHADGRRIEPDDFPPARPPIGKCR